MGGLLGMELDFDEFVNYVAHVLVGDAVSDFGEESAYHHALGDMGRDAAGLEVEELVRVDRADGGGVGALDVVGFDFQHGDRVCAGAVVKQQVAHGLVGVSLLALGGDPNQSVLDGLRIIGEHAANQQVAGRADAVVILARDMLDVLSAVSDEETAYLAVSTALGEVEIDALFVDVSAEGGRGDSECGVASDTASRGGYGGRLAVPTLDGGELEVRAVLGDDFDVGVNQRRSFEIGASIVGVTGVDQGNLGLAVGDDERVVPLIAGGCVLGDEVEEGVVEDGSWRRVDEGALRPEGASEGFVAIERGSDGAEPSLDELRMLAGGVGERLKDDAALRGCVGEVGGDELSAVLMDESCVIQRREDVLRGRGLDAVGCRLGAIRRGG